MKVLLLGASGFIGFPVAQALVRAGHIVYGSTRSKKTAHDLLAPEEIIPLVVEHDTEEGRKVWGDVAKTVDVVIDTIPATSPEVPLATFDHVLALNKDRPDGAKVTFIYTGGSWVHSRGSGGLESWTDERQPHTGRNKLTAWRWEVEKEVLKSTTVHGIVIRPSMLYGRTGSLFGMLVFEPALAAAKKGEKFETPGLPETRFLTIHQDDLADLYVRVAERGPVLGGQAFVGANPQSERLSDLLDAVVRVSGAKGYTVTPPPKDNAFLQSWSSTTNLKPSLGQALTGWTPRKLGLVDGIDLYWLAFRAKQIQTAKLE